MFGWLWGKERVGETAIPLQEEQQQEFKSPKSISQRTIALMISAYVFLFSESVVSWADEPRLDLNKFRITLFAMNFERSFLDRCEHKYRWRFPDLLPALF